MQKITPFLWFDGRAEEAAQFYISIFKDMPGSASIKHFESPLGKGPDHQPISQIDGITHYGDTGPGPKGSVMGVTFRLEGQTFIALNGGPQFTFSPAISFMVNCASQQEIDYFWERLCEGGKPIQCGWLQDKFGLSWQIVPAALSEMLQDPDSAKPQRVMKALMQMTKLDLAQLRQAYESA